MIDPAIETIITWSLINGWTTYANVGFYWTGPVIPVLSISNAGELATFDLVSNDQAWADISRIISKRKYISDRTYCVTKDDPCEYMMSVCSNSGTGLIVANGAIKIITKPAKNINVIHDSKAEAIRRMHNIGKFGFINHFPSDTAFIAKRFYDINAGSDINTYDIYHEIPHTLSSPESMASAIARGIKKNNSNAIEDDVYWFKCDLT